MPRRSQAVDSDEDIEIEAAPQANHSGSSTPRLTGTVPNFRPGNLIRVEMENFLTFSKTVFKPGPRMNLVIGPNGTGKSTIVSAVCIVFGGKPSILGRSPDLAAFVKYGTTTASVVAHVYEPSHPKGYVEVRRDFDNDGQNIFYLNGERARQRDIQEKVVQKYDIQLDNMSQFMPQEKIAEFTNHKPEELLKLAIRSLGGASKEEEYFTLVEEDGQLSNQTESLQKNRDQLEKLTAEQEQDHAEVEAYREQQKRRAELDLLLRFRPTVEEIETRFIYSDLRKKCREVDQEVQQLEGDLKQRMSGPVNACVQAVDAAKSAYDSTKASINSCITRKDTVSDRLNEANRSLLTRLKELRDLHNQSEKVRHGVQMAEEKLAQAEDAYESATQVSEPQLQQELDDYEEKRQQLRDRRREASVRVSPLEDSIQQANRIVKHFGQRLEGLADVRRQRMERLRGLRNGEMIIKVEELVQHMKRNNAFQRRVYGPVLAEVEVEEPYHARIMEHSVSGWLCHAFVLESTNDSRVLLDECRKRFNGYKPDMMTTPTTRNDEIDYETIDRQQPPFPVDDNLRDLGIVCTVSDIYRAPDAVRAALNAMASLHTIYVGTEDARRNQEVLRNNIGLPAWYTPETRCMLSGSRYDQSARNLRVDTSFTYVKGELYKGSMSETQNQREEFKRRIRDEEQKLQSYRSQLEDLKKEEEHMVSNLRAVDADIRRVTEQRTLRRKKKSEVDRARRHVEEMKERAARRDETQLRNRLKHDIKGLQKDALEHVSGFTALTKELTVTLEKHDDAIVRREIVGQELLSEQAKHHEATQALENKLKFRNELREERDSMKEAWKQKKQIADAKISNEELNNNQERLTPFMTRPLSELDDAIQHLEGEIQGLSSSGRGLIDAYELREQKIEQIKKEIGNQEEWFSKRQSDLSRRKQSFLAWLEGGIAQMRSKFASLYRRLGCPADIRLLNVERNSLKDLTLQVLVSYRKDTELRPISATANSGGEKMCCTMIFCFSLQLEEERIPPFIMVDELNQGLDPDNEMKIMTMMIEDSAKDMGAQSFVVTPKLLSNLPLGVCTKTHIVFNGHVRGAI